MVSLGNDLYVFTATTIMPLTGKTLNLLIASDYQSYFRLPYSRFPQINMFLFSIVTILFTDPKNLYPTHSTLPERYIMMLFRIVEDTLDPGYSTGR
jgi:hypothetical protein